MLRPGTLLLFCVIIFSGCSEFSQAVKDAKKDIPPPPKDNYIVLLDLSDRLLYNNQQQVSKDLSVMRCIFNVFKERINEKDPSHLYYAVKDKIKVMIAPQRTTPKNLYDEVGNLRVELAAESPEKKAQVVETAEKTFNSKLPDIYKQAIVSMKSDDYAGADIWKYMEEDLEDDLEADAQNTLFIITDGYMDFEHGSDRSPVNNRYTSCTQIINTLKKFPDWNKKFDEGDYGLVSTGKKFSKLRVILLELNPKEDWSNEYSLLTKIWAKWLGEMSINTFRFVKNENINETRESIEKFMSVQLAQKAELVPWEPVPLSPQNATVSRPASVITQVNEPAQKTVTRSISKPVTISKDPERDILPPNENMEDVGVKKKSNVAPLKTSNNRKEDNDILSDGTPKKGFNTGIRKNNRKP
jgi:hypothetical protein